MSKYKNVYSIFRLHKLFYYRIVMLSTCVNEDFDFWLSILISDITLAVLQEMLQKVGLFLIVVLV